MLQLTDFDALLAEAEEDRRKRHETIEMEYKATLEAIERVKSLMLRRNPLAMFPPIVDEEPESAVEERSERAAWPGLRAAIREAIDKNSERFTLDDVVAHLASHYRHPAKRVTISGELWRMNRNREIAIRERGSGSRPNVYGKVKTLDDIKAKAAG